MSEASISYPHYDHHRQSYQQRCRCETLVQSRTGSRSNHIAHTAMATCYSSYELAAPGVVQTAGTSAASLTARSVNVAAPPPPPPVQKDYSRPLHVDCSVEYELPNQAKPPVGVRNEPLLMIHPCYFRKIESQRRSPFVNNLPTRQPTSSAAKRRVAAVRGQQIPQQMPQQAAQYPVQYSDRQQQQLWDSLPPLVPISTTAQTYCKRDTMVSGCGTTYSSGSDSGHWTDPERSPDRPDDKHILTGKYRQYLRAHRLHPYVTSAIPIASTFPQIQQVCYNV
ncbi:hypothetical protein Trydic_g15772 [Trypoxylus dichotomus]